MTRVAVCGPRLDAAAAVLGLEVDHARPELVLLDLDDAGAVAAAAAIDPAVPRIVVGSQERCALLRAAGRGAAIASSPEPADLGPLVASALPAPARRPTRLVVVTGPRGGTGRTMLVAALAERITRRLSVLVIDATGSGDAAARLGLAPPPWTDLEGLVDELTTEQLGIVAAERDGLRILGGAPAMPSAPLLAAVVREAVGLADVVIVDAPSIHDDRGAMLRAAADRVLLLAAAGDQVDAWIDERTWPVVTRSRAERIGAHAALRSLPDDAAAARGRAVVGGPLARAYDELADLLVIDAT
jgi:Mrp family chromosome partitioning ATPase